ncbi:MAG: Peptidyl-prolyl cis-trans isomerase A [Firmicutes bacterium]|nr:Peptidyl-prolyl cis-trans isomerase A [candidate division NPL-UPA2 bacterium]
MQRVLLSILIVSLLGFALTGCQAERPKPVVTIEMAAGGTIRIELDPDAAPNTVNNFISLVRDGFYDGLVFHRIIPGFMIQGGCPDGNGTGGPGYAIMGEFAANGVRNPLKHERGVISMARGQLYNSAGSQFFIMHANFEAERNRQEFDRQYAAFGRVISGMEVVDRIVNGPSDQAQNGLALEPREVMKKVTVDTLGVQYEAPVVIRR